MLCGKILNKYQVIKFTGECKRVFHVSCTDINNFSPKLIDSSCVEIHLSVDKN